MFKTKISKILIALYFIIIINYCIFHVPVNDFKIERKWDSPTPQKYYTTSGYTHLKYIGISGSKNLQSGREVDFNRLFLELGAIAAGTISLIILINIFKKENAS